MAFAKTAQATVVLCGLLSWSGRVDAADALKIELVAKAQHGQGQPALVVRAERPLKRIALQVARSTDAKKLSLKAGPVAGGREHRFALELAAVGSAQFVGTLDVETEDGESGAMPIDVRVELVAPVTLTVDPQDVQLDARRLRLSSSRELTKAEVTLMSDTGTPLGTQTIDLGGRDGDDKYALNWEAKKGTLMRISVKGIDADGFFGGVDLFPWRVDIPHEEVNFRSGSADVDATETAKLESSYTLVTQAADKFGKLAPIRLFIAGHTDTVGDNGKNRALSEQRARAIGRWFRRRGVKIPILFAGFGEDALLVDTADETDERKNRRAEYIVSVEAPAMPGNARFSPLD